MMNATLFKNTLKSNWILLVIFFTVMFLYLSIIMSMYDPSGAAGMQEFIASMPDAFLKAFNFELMGTGFTAFVASYYYGFLIIMFPLIYCIIIGNKLIARHVDNGSMAYILSTPNTRIRIAATQALYILFSIGVLITLTTLFGIAVGEGLFPGELAVGPFILLNLGALLMIWTISAISFFCSCLFSDTKYSLAFGGGIPIAFFLIKMLSGVGNGGGFRYISLFDLFDPAKILAQDASIWITNSIFMLLTVVLYAGGILIFNKKDLPL